MITFNSQNLFASGPATLDAHSPALRTAETPKKGDVLLKAPPVLVNGV